MVRVRPTVIGKHAEAGQRTPGLHGGHEDRVADPGLRVGDVVAPYLNVLAIGVRHRQGHRVDALLLIEVDRGLVRAGAAVPKVP